MKYSRKSIIFLSYVDGIPLVSWCQVLYVENSRESIIFLSCEDGIPLVTRYWVLYMENSRESIIFLSYIDIDGIYYHKSLFRSLYFCLPVGTGYTHTRIIILFYYSHSSSGMDRCLIYYLTPTLGFTENKNLLLWCSVSV